MATDEIPAEEAEAVITVVIPEDTEESTEEAPEGDTTVVVVNDETPSEVTPVALDHESRITSLENAVTALAIELEEVSRTAETAEVIADIALMEPEEPSTPEPEPEEEGEEETPPRSTGGRDGHWLTRSRDQWKKKGN